MLTHKPSIQIYQTKNRIRLKSPWKCSGIDNTFRNLRHKFACTSPLHTAQQTEWIHLNNHIFGLSCARVYKFVEWVIADTLSVLTSHTQNIQQIINFITLISRVMYFFLPRYFLNSAQLGPMKWNVNRWLPRNCQCLCGYVCAVSFCEKYSYHSAESIVQIVGWPLMFKLWSSVYKDMRTESESKRNRTQLQFIIATI